MAQVTQLDFSGHTIFCGVDVHKKNWRVNIQDGELELEDFSQDADAAILYQHLVRRYRGARFKVCYEAGFSGFSAQRWLRQQAHKDIVCKSAIVPCLCAFVSINKKINTSDESQDTKNVLSWQRRSLSVPLFG